MNKLYEFTMKILRGDSTEMPDGLTGAYVTCYAAAPDYQASVRKGVLAITQMGYKFDDLRDGVREIPLASWAEYLGKVWPEYANQMPTVAQLPDLVTEGQIFFGPFAGFTS